MKTEYYNVSGIGLLNPELTKNYFMFDNTLLEALPISEGVRREMLLEKELIRKYHIKQRVRERRWQTLRLLLTSSRCPPCADRNGV